MDADYPDWRALLRIVARACKVTEKEVVEALRNVQRGAGDSLWNRRKKKGQS